MIDKTPYEFFTNAPDSLKSLVEGKKTEYKPEETMLETEILLLKANK